LQTASREQQLAEKYAPIVYIRNQNGACDKRGSPYAPVPVEFLFEVEEIRLRTHQSGRTTDVANAFSAADLYGKDDTYFIDVPGNPKRPGCTYEQDYLARTDDYPPVAYAYIAREEGRAGFSLQYWLFYYFNDWNNTHEGDWETIQLTFAGPAAEDALSQDPLNVGFSQHSGGERADWDDGKLRREGNRPVSHLAAGANANLFEPNIILGRGERGTGFGCDDASPPSRRVALDVVLVEEPDGPASPFAWLAFDGRWGERQPWEFNGPTGPNDKRSWREPFSWMEDLRSSSIVVPGRSTVGPDAVNLFCEIIWVASSPFVWLFRVPLPALVAGLIGVSVGLVYLTTRTTYRPVVIPPLRRSRAFGQMFTAAGALYRRHALLFLAFGSLFIPMGFIMAGIQWLLFSPPDLDTVTSFFAADRVAGAVLALTLGNIASSLVYWFVTVGTVAAVARLDAGFRHASVDDYVDVLRRLPPLVLPRLKALGIVLLLTFSVVGIPWAVRNAVRWAFIEGTILLAGTAPKDALEASAAATEGRWPYTFLCLAVLAVLGYLLGPALAIILLLATSGPLSVINMVSSLVFVAIAPYVAIVQALLFLELTSDRRP